MSLIGNLRSYSATQLLNLIHLASKTGTLTVRNQSTMQLAFYKGKLIDAAFVEEQLDLADLLWQDGKLTDAQLMAIQANRGSHSDVEMGRLLIQAGILTREEILLSSRQRVMEIILELFTWETGEFSFATGELPSQDRVMVVVDLALVIGDGEKQRKEWRRLQELLPDMDVRLRCARHPKSRLQDIELTLREWRVMIASNTRETMRQIANANRLSAFQIRRIVYGLLQVGLVEIVPPALRPVPIRVHNRR